MRQGNVVDGRRIQNADMVMSPTITPCEDPESIRQMVLAGQKRIRYRGWGSGRRSCAVDMLGAGDDDHHGQGACNGPIIGDDVLPFDDAAASVAVQL